MLFRIITEVVEKMARKKNPQSGLAFDCCQSECQIITLPAITGRQQIIAQTTRMLWMKAQMIPLSSRKTKTNTPATPRSRIVLNDEY